MSKLPTNVEPSGALTIHYAAIYLSCTEKALYELVRKRKVPFRRQGRKILFLRSELDRFLHGLPGFSFENLQTAEQRLREAVFRVGNHVGN